MAVFYDPTLKVTLSGTEITSYSLETSFQLDTKLEESHLISSTTTPDTLINLSNISNTKMLMFHSSNSFTIILTKNITSPLLEVFDYDFEIPCIANIPCLLSVDQDFIDSIKSIAIKTANTNQIKVNVRAYGEYIITP